MPSLTLHKDFQGTQNSLKLTGPPLDRKHFMPAGTTFTKKNVPDLTDPFFSVFIEMISLPECHLNDIWLIYIYFFYSNRSLMFICCRLAYSTNLSDCQPAAPPSCHQCVAQAHQQETDNRNTNVFLCPDWGLHGPNLLLVAMQSSRCTPHPITKHQLHYTTKPASYIM